jgi:DNA recombination protein RmuC
MDLMTASIISLLAFALGAAVVWVLFVRRIQSNLSALERQNLDLAQERGQLIERSSRLTELLGTVDQLEGENITLARELSWLKEVSAGSSAELKAERAATADLADRLRTAEQVLRELRVELGSVESEKAAIEARLLSETNSSAEKIKLLQDAKEQLSASFEALANKILEEKSKKFAEQNMESLGNLLNPFKEKISEFQTKVETVYNTETKDRVALGEQVRQLMMLNQTLSQDAKNLTSALRGSSKTQGTWGELVLDRIMEASGLRKGEEYVVQPSYQNEAGGRSQPDVTINLPEDRHLVVDSKVSLRDYEESIASDGDESLRQAALKRHTDSIRNHMKSLSSKNYQDLYQLKTLDFVLMFVPVESAFMAAITHDRELFMDGWNKNVLLVSPSTLLFVLRTVSHLWRQEAQSRNAQDIARRGAELYDRLCNFLADLDQLGVRLNQAQESFNDARNRLSRNKGNVIRQAKMLRDLGVKPNKRMPPSFSQSEDDSDGTEHEIIDQKQLANSSLSNKTDET